MTPSVTVTVDSLRTTARLSSPLILGDTYAVTFSGLTEAEAAASPQLVVLGAMPGEVAARTDVANQLAMTTEECVRAFKAPPPPPVRPREFPQPPPLPNPHVHGADRPHGSVRLHFYVTVTGATIAQGDLVLLWAPYEFNGEGTPIQLKGDKGDQGERGPEGPAGQDGRNGVYVAMDGLYAFHISQGGDHPEDGHLWIHAQDDSTLYAHNSTGGFLLDDNGDKIPLYSVDARGHLVYRFYYQDSEHVELDLGRVVTHEGLYAFHVSDGSDGETAGHLMLHGQNLAQIYATDANGDLILDENDDPIPLFKLQNDGHLIYTFYGEDGEAHATLDIGDVRGPALTWDDLTDEQKAALKGEKGDDGDKGDQGDPLTWDDLTEEQKASLKGDKGDPGQDGLTETQIREIVVDTMGDPDEAPTAGSETWVTSGGLWTVQETILARILDLGAKIANIRADIAGAYHFKGSVDSYDELPTTDLNQGDVWNVRQDSTHPDGMNYAWTGSEWDALGGLGDLSAYLKTSDLDTALQALSGRNSWLYTNVCKPLADAEGNISSIGGYLTGIQAVIPSGASSSNQLATASDVSSAASTASSAYSLASGVDTRVADIEAVVPSTATSSNKLATLADVPSQVQANWNESDPNSKAYIQNKPSLASVAASGSGADVALTIGGNSTDVQTWASGADQFLGTLPSGSDILSQTANGDVYRGSIPTDVLTTPPKINGDQLALSRAIAAEFDSAVSYAAGDYCTKDGKLYKATAATAGAWDAANWTEVTVTDEMGQGGGGAAFYEVEYLESNGTQYIDTGIVAGLGVRVVADLEWMALATDAVAFGSTWDGGTQHTDRFFLNVSHTNAAYLSVGANGTYYNPITSALAISTGVRHVYDFTVSASSASLLIDGTSALNESGTFTFSKQYNIFAFARSNRGTAGEKSSIRIYSLKIYSGGVLVRDFVPVRSGFDCGLFDKVSRMFFLNQGTGVFTFGPDVNPSVPTESPAFTGTPTAPTAAAGTNTTQLATTAFVQTAVAGKADAALLRYAFASPTTTASTTTTTDDTLSATLTDRAINTISVASGVTTLNLTFPAEVSGRARDFFVRIVTAGTDLAAVGLTDGSGAADIEIGASDLADWNKAGTHLVLFTEIAAGKFMASKRLEEAST